MESSPSLQSTQTSPSDSAYRLSVTSNVPRFIVDLDKPPEERWTEILEAYKPLCIQALTTVDEIIGTGFTSKLVTSFFSRLAKMKLVKYHAELRAMAKQVGVSLGKLVLLQIAYEVFAACTSVVLNGPDGRPIHARTMDWDMPILQRMTIEVDFRKRGETLFVATTWAGYVGVLTGMRPHAYAVSINYRRLGDSVVRNFWKGAGGSWPIGFLLRAVFEEDESYAKAVGSLSRSALMAPVYIIVSGVSTNEGILITRNRTKAEQTWTLEEHGPIVQTNMDHWRNEEPENAWQDIENSTGRRQFARLCLKHIDPDTIAQDLFTMMLVAPILAVDTVYANVMSASRNELMTYVDPPHAQVMSARKYWRRKHTELAEWIP